MKLLTEQSKFNKILTLAVVLILLALPLFISNPTVLQILILIIFYAYLTSCWNFVGGFAGVLPLGHSAFVGIGAYVSTSLYLTWGLSPWIGMLAGGVIAALMGILIGLPTLKLRGAYFALATIAFGEAMRVLVENIEHIGPFPVRGPKGLLIDLAGNSFAHFQFTSKVPYYYIILIMLLIVLLITFIMMNSKVGYYLAAGGEEPDAAAALGIKVSKYKLIAMAISCFLTALGGTFYAQMFLYFYPKSILGLDLSYEIAFIALIGGRGTILGPVIGALLLRPVGDLTRIYLSDTLPGLHLIIFGLILVIVMRYQPKGLVLPLSRLLTRINNRFTKKSGEEQQEEVCNGVADSK